ncbi:MAG: ketose-bisphosphate aldolase [Eubacteriaceae bacterium]|nr:ketose-bisphosphate aldolase [Eubacteriaceae bacterium]
MGFITSAHMLADALEGGYAVGAFNVNNMEIIQGIIDAAIEQKSPFILQVSQGARKYAGMPYIIKLCEAAMAEGPEDIVLHLDHGESFEVCREFLDSGFMSVMIDASSRPYSENIAETKRVAEYAHSKGAVVEGELGMLSGIEDDVKVDEASSKFTDPSQACEFVEKTGVDSLAIAIGTSHGAFKYSGDPYLDFARLEEIASLLPGFPLVLHGASSVPDGIVSLANEYGGKITGSKGVPEEMLAKAASMGIAKINVDTDIRLAVTASIRKYLYSNPEDFDPRGYLREAREAVKGMVMHKMQAVLNSSGRMH